MDALWHGGYRPGELGMVVAPTGVGKSMLLSMLAAEAFWAGKSVMYLTYELSPAQIQMRIATAILGKGQQRLTGTWDQELALVHKSRGLAAPPPGPIEIYNDAQTWPDVEARLERFKGERGKYPDVLLLDSADDVAFRGKFEKRHEGLLDTFVYLRNLAHEKNVAVWTTGQLNRESIEKARINLKMIGDAFAKAQKSHYVIGMAQSTELKNHPGGPRLALYVLKDSNWGTGGGWLECSPAWGVGDNGFPGLLVESSNNLPLPTRPAAHG